MGARNRRGLRMTVAAVAMGIAVATPGAVRARGPADDEPWGTFGIAPSAGVAGTVIHVIGYCGDMPDGPPDYWEVHADAWLLAGPHDVIAEVTVPLLPYDTAYQLFGATLTVPAGAPYGVYSVHATCSFRAEGESLQHSLYPYGGYPFYIPGFLWGSLFQPAIAGVHVVTGRALSDVRGGLDLLGFGADQPSTGTTTIPSTAPPAPGDVPIPAPPGGGREEETATTTTSTTTTTSPRR